MESSFWIPRFNHDLTTANKNHTWFNHINYLPEFQSNYGYVY